MIKSKQRYAERIRELDAEYERLQHEFNAVLERAKNLESGAQNAENALHRSPSQQTLDDFIAAKGKASAAAEAVTVLSRVASTDCAGRRFRDENPDFREILKKAADERRAEAERNLQSVVAAEQEHLGKQGLADMVDDAPAVKMARSAVDRWKELATEISKADENVVWHAYAGEFLQDESGS